MPRLYSPVTNVIAAFAMLASAGLVVWADDSKPADPKPAEKPAAPEDKKDASTATGEKSGGTTTSTSEPAYVLDFKVNRIDGSEEDLSIYKGKVVLIVNVASNCGFTPQYAGLQKLYSDKKDSGLVVLGFPANDFKNQEPGSNKDIAEFCSGEKSQYHISFPMFEKISVKGPTVAPLYKKLASQPAPIGGEPKWNFTKFLVDRSGNVVARYESSIKPDDKNLVAKIDELLKAK